MFRGLMAVRYIFWEMLPSFFLGVLVFVFILLTFQALRLTEFILVHGVDITTVLQIVVDLSVSFLPAIFPMSLLFSVLLTYGRLSADSEIVAMKSVGLHMGHLLLPAVFLGVCVCIVSAQTSFRLAPWGNRQFELLVSRLSATKTGITLREGTFAEGFFNLVLYANQVDSKHGLLKKVFIYDERNPKVPITIVAREGQLVHDAQVGRLDASIRLAHGNIHRITEGRHTKIDFQTYDINLTDTTDYADRKKSGPSLTIDEINEALQKPDIAPDEKRLMQTEYHKRWAIAIACVLFSLVGVGLGTITNRRNVRSSNFVVCISLIVLYWVIYVVSENLARGGHVYPPLALWSADFVFTGAAYWSLRRAWA
jgi:lipopolysaccharide export system permease protein